MFPHLSRVFRQKPAQRCVPPGTRLYAIGDIHGRADLLRRIHRLIYEDACHAQAGRKVVVYLGDYIDRGPDSRGVIDLLIHDPIPGCESVHLKGNHDDCLTRFLVDPKIARLWLSHGGDATLRSYGVAPPCFPWDFRDIRRAQQALRRALPAEHMAFFRGLRSAYTEGDYLFVHAGIRPGVPLALQTERDMLWIGEKFLDSHRDHGKIVVHGHSITAGPDVRQNRIGVDSGAYATGKLTCLILEGTERCFLQARADDIVEGVG